MNFSFPSFTNSSLIQLSNSTLPFFTAGAIVSISPREVTPVVNPLFSFDHANNSVLSCANAAPLPSFNAAKASLF